jgi:AcrR family transcriptional regulator
MTAAASRGSYAKSAQVRRGILDACVEAFCETGFYGATTKDIAARAGVSHTGLRHHFPAKEDLLIAMLEWRSEHSRDYLASARALNADTDPIGALRGQLAVLVDNELRPGLIELHCVLSGEAVAPGHPAHGYYAKRYQDLRRFYTRVFAALADRGELSGNVAPETLATTTISLINGLQQQWLFARDQVDIEGTLSDFLASHVPALGRDPL